MSVKRSLGRLVVRLGWFAAGAIIVTLFIIIRDSGRLPVEPWHTELLTSEFTADRSDEIRTFEAYQQLESRLFRELDERIYAQVESVPELGLSRFSPGSAADPRGREPDWNRSVTLPVENPVGGVLLLHGLTDSPYTFRALAGTLHEQGYWVLSLRLPGHGTAPSGLTRVRWQDMAAAVRLAVVHLAEKVDGKPIHIIGYSTGAPLALDYTLDATDETAMTVPTSLVLVSPAIGVSSAAAFAGITTRLGRIPGLERLSWTAIVPEFDPYKYNSFTTNAAALVHGITSSVGRRIADREAADDKIPLPRILAFKSTVDATVSTDAVVDRLLARLDADRNELVIFDINRYAIGSSIIVADPAPFTDRLLADATLPFAVTFISNKAIDSREVVARRKPQNSDGIAELVPLNLQWPEGVISLSHVALPFPPDDPLYGRYPPADHSRIYLGQIAILGERGLIRFPSDWLLRLRHNPFYDYMESRVLDWLDDTGMRASTDPDTSGPG